MKNIAIFASGGGSNAQAIIDYLKEDTRMQVALIVSNRKDAGVLDRARQNDIPTYLLTKKTLLESEDLLDILKEKNIASIVLAGFLLLVPQYLVRSFPGRIFNIHPALLPKFGGKGMYGMNVHRAVKTAKESESGPTIHYVNEHYDTGAIIFQAKCSILPDDQPEDIAKKVLSLEHQYYPKIVASIIADLP